MTQVSLTNYEIFFRAFSNETKLGIIKVLRKGPKTVKEICNKTGFEQSRISHNLKKLETCGFVQCNRKGKNTVCALDKNVSKIISVADRYTEKYGKNLKNCDC